MRAVVQRVSSAKVTVEKQVVGQVKKGLFILLGISQTDTKGDAQLLARKISKLRLMADENGKMNLDSKSSQAEILVVSQFTLYSDTKDGNRPSFVQAASSKIAQPLYELFIATLKEEGLKVETGQFGAYMDIDAKLDGPVTIIVEQ